MNCLICNRDTGPDGTNAACYFIDDGNYGSTVLDNDGLINFSICDRCLVDRRDRIRGAARQHCMACGERQSTYAFFPLEDDKLRAGENTPK